jgi:Methylamine utilisation protein MauE
MLYGVIGAPTAWWRVARGLVCALLLSAAWGKAQELASDSIWGTRFWESRLFLASVVLVEIAFAVWLGFGLYPKWSWLAALSLFMTFALFSFYLGMKGAKYCPCFGKGSDPMLVGLLDAVIALALALCPTPAAARLTISSAPWRFYGFGLTAVFLMAPAGLNMAYYSHTEVGLELRLDRRLYRTVKAQLRSPSSEELLQQLREATRLEFTLDRGLSAAPPNYGLWGTLNAWSVMMMMAKRQPVPARWERTDTGYHLAAAAPWGGRAVPWLVSGGVCACVCLSLGYMARKPGYVARIFHRVTPARNCTART